MDKRERFAAVLRGAPVDRAPMGFWFHFAPACHGGAAMAQAHLEYYRATDLDIVKVMNDTGYAPIGRVRVRQPQDWLRLEPTPLADALFQSHLDGLQRIVAAVGDEAPVMTTCFNPWNQAIAILQASDPAAYPTSVEARVAWAEQWRRAPEPVLHGLRIIADDLAAFYSACIRQAGADGIYFSAQGGERAYLDDAEHAQTIAASDRTVLDAIHAAGGWAVGHVCGRGLALERYVDYPVEMVNWAYQADNLSLSAGRTLFAKPVLGGLDEHGPLATGDRAALRQELRAAFKALGPRGFMLGAGCTVPSDIPWERLMTAKQEADALSAELWGA